MTRCATIRRNASRISFFAVLGLTACAFALLHCGSSASSDEPTSESDAASVDATTPADASVDVGSDTPSSDGSSWQTFCLNIQDDAGFVTDWPGWRRVDSTTEPCCLIDTPVNLQAAVRPLTWHACDAGVDAAPGCLDIDPPPAPPSPPAFFAIEGSYDTNGAPLNVLIARGIDVPGSWPTEIDVFDVDSGKPVAAWRVDGTPHASSCLATADLSASTVTLAARLYASGDQIYASGSAAALMNSPTFFRFPIPYQIGNQEHGTSATTFAFDLEPGGIVYRVPIGTTNTINTAGHSTTPLLLDFVHGDDVFGFTGSGWTEEHLVRSDGTTVAMRAVPNRHVVGFATDGTTIFWTEEFGGATPTDLPTQYEVWSAPYTTSPAALAATASRLAVIDGLSREALAVASRGVYAVIVSRCVQIVRMADGSVRKTCVDGSSYFRALGLLTDSDVWVIVGAINGAPHYAVRRLAIPP